MTRLLSCIIFVLLLATANAQKMETFSTPDYVRALKLSTDVMLNDVTSPVAAARYYAYICLAANQTHSLFQKQQNDFAFAVKGLAPFVVEQSLIERSDESFATILALYKAGAKLLPSGYMLQPYTDSLMRIAKKKR